MQTSASAPTTPREQVSNGELDQGLEFFRRMFGASWITQGLWVAAELGIADLLARRPGSAQELAEKSGADPGALFRLLRALASVGVFAQDGQGRFMLTPLAERLRSDTPGSQRALAIMMGAEFHQAWGELLHSVRTGRPGFDARYEQPFFRYMTERPERHRLYDAAMEAVHGPETEPMLAAYDFARFQTVVDIGGGNASVLVSLLGRHPGLFGVLFDLPAVAERTRAAHSVRALAGRIRIEGGDFFKAVPAGADAYLLRHVLHDWQDAEAIRILERCREAARPGGRILVVETVLSADDAPGFGKWLDLMMLLVAGRERTEAEYRALFSAAGLELARVVPTRSEVSILEGVAP